MTTHTIRTRTLAADAFSRLSVQMGYAAIMIYAFTHGVRTVELGVIAVSMLVPSLAFTVGAHALMARAGPRGAFIAGNLLRGLLLIALPAIGSSLLTLAVISGLLGLLQQISNAAKLTFDASVIAESRRAIYNSERAFLAGMATIVGPSLAGLLGGVTGGGLAVVVAGLAALAAALGLSLCPVAPARSNASAPARTGVGASVAWSWLTRESETAILVACYCVLLAILEMETPLVFPFVRETYARNVDVSGTLLGICGVGSLAGALLMRRLEKPLIPPLLTLLLIFDGATLAAASFGPPLVVSYGLFVLLGIISSVTTVTVETQVQSRAPAGLHPVLFSMMGLMSGAGGACLTLVSTHVAESWGAGHVLRGCAELEIAVGCAGTLILVALSYRRFAARRPMAVTP